MSKVHLAVGKRLVSGVIHASESAPAADFTKRYAVCISPPAQRFWSKSAINVAQVDYAVA